MRRRNRTIIRVIEGLGDRDDPTMLAYLPLSTEGAKRLVEGRFDAKNPSPEWIVREGEAPVGARDRRRARRCHRHGRAAGA